MQEFLKYVAASPVLDWIGHFTEDTTASGNAKLALKLTAAAGAHARHQGAGHAALQGNDVTCGTICRRCRRPPARSNSMSAAST
jgi:uncharacterized protein YhdP